MIRQFPIGNSSENINTQNINNSYKDIQITGENMTVNNNIHTNDNNQFINDDKLKRNLKFFQLVKIFLDIVIRIFVILIMVKIFTMYN